MFYLYNLDKINDKVPPADSVYGQLTKVIIQFLGFVYYSRIFFFARKKYATRKLYGTEDALLQFLCPMLAINQGDLFLRPLPWNDEKQITVACLAWHSLMSSVPLIMSYECG